MDKGLRALLVHGAVRSRLPRFEQDPARSNHSVVRMTEGLLLRPRSWLPAASGDEPATRLRVVALLSRSPPPPPSGLLPLPALPNARCPRPSFGASDEEQRHESRHPAREEAKWKRGKGKKYAKGMLKKRCSCIASDLGPD